MEEFEQWYLDTYYKPYGFVPPANLFERYEDTYIRENVYQHNLVWQHLQAKVVELQKKNAWLSDVAERENKRANKLKEEHVSTTILLGKVEQQKAELQKRVKWLEDRLKATDTLSKMRSAVIGSFNTQEFNARTRRKMMILKQAEQALKGGA